MAENAAFGAKSSSVTDISETFKQKSSTVIQVKCFLPKSDEK